MKSFGRAKQILYSFGTLGQSIADNIFGVYLIYFLLPPKETGMPELLWSMPVFAGLTVLGIIIIFGRIIDSISDPFIAWLSDSARFRMGRRKFFLVTGAFPLAVSAALLFFPPDIFPSAGNAVYTAVMLAFFFFAFTWYVAPYLALIPELTDTHRDRIFISVMIAVFSLLGAGVVMMGIPVMQECLAAAGTEPSSALKISICAASVLAFISLAAGAVPVQEKPAAAGKEKAISLMKSLKLTLANRTFIIYMTGTILYWFTFNILRSLIAYYPVVLLHREQSFQSILMAVLFGSSAVCFVFISILSSKISSKKLMMTGLMSFGILTAMTYFIGMFGEYSTAAAIVHMVLLGVPVSILLTIPNTMVADISQIDSCETGDRREAMFFGTQGFFMKINYGIAAAIASFLFAVFGKDAASPLGVQLAGPVGGLFAAAGFFVFMLYPQKQISEKLKKIREKNTEL